jgi:hypothetical protein
MYYRRLRLRAAPPRLRLLDRPFFAALRLDVPRAVEVRLPPALLRPVVLFRRLRVAAAFRADADRAALGRAADAWPPFFPPLRDALRFTGFPLPEPLFFPPPVSLFTVAHARRSASRRDTPRSSYPSSMCRACRFCLFV